MKSGLTNNRENTNHRGLNQAEAILGLNMAVLLLISLAINLAARFIIKKVCKILDWQNNGRLKQDKRQVN